MSGATELVMKHGLATAMAIVATVIAYYLLETLNAAGTALVFILFLALFNGVAALFGRAGARHDG